MAGQQTGITLSSLILWQHYGLVWRHFPNVHSRLARRSAKAHRLSSQEKAAYYKESAGQCTEVFRLTGVL